MLLLVAQSVASEHARKQRSVKIYLSLSFLLTSLFGALYCIGVDVSLVLMLIVLVLVFYLLKLLAIAFFSELQRLLPRHLWATTESSLSTGMRLLFIALLPLIGVSGDRNDLAAIVLIVGCVLAFATTLLLVSFLTAGQKRKDLNV